MVSGDLTLVSAGTSSIDIYLAGNLYGSATMLHSGSNGKITFDGTGNQTSTFTGRLPHVTVNKAGGTLTFASSFAISKTFTYVAGTVVFESAYTTTFSASDHWGIDSGSVVFNNVVISKCSSCTFSMTGTMKIGGDLTITDSGNMNSGNIELQGNLTSTDSTVDGSATITLTGTNSQLVTVGSYDIPNGTFTINKTSGTVTLGANLTLNGSGQDLTVTSGTLDVAGYNLTVPDVVTITDTLKLKGNETFSQTTFSLNTSSSTVEYYDSAVTADLSKLPPSSFKNLILGAGKTHNFETGSGNEITINGDISSSGSSSTKSVLRSLSSGTQWYLKVLGTESFSDNVDVKDSNASNGSAITAYYSTDSGNNTNWVFTPPSITWDGGGSTNHFSEAANWSTNTVPTATDIIVFNSTSVKNCEVDVATTVKQIVVDTGYTGELSLVANLTVNETFTQNSGTVSLGSYGLTLKGDLTVSGTSNFNAGTSTVTFTEPAASPVTINVTGNITFHHVVLNLNGHLDIDSSIYLKGNLTYTEGYIDGGDLKVEGHVNQGVNSNGGTGNLVFTGIWFQTLTGSGVRGAGELPNVQVFKHSGTLTLASVINTKKNWLHTEGVVAYGSSELCLNGSSQTITTNGMSFNDLYVNMSGDLTLVGNLPVKGNLTVNAWSVLIGDLYAYGNVTTSVATQSSTTGKVHFVGNNTQTFSGAGVNGLFTKVNVEKTGGSLNITDSIKLYGDFTVTSGTLNASGTLTMVGTSATLTTNGQSLNNLTLDTNGGITINGTLSMNGGLNIKSVTDLSGSKILLKKDLTLEDASFTGSPVTTIEMLGTDNAVITKVGSGVLSKGNIDIKKTGGASVTLAGNLTLGDGYLHNITGVLDLDGYNLTTSSDVDVDDTLVLKGNETVSASAFTIDTSTSKVIYKDSGVTAYLSNLPFSTFKHLTLGEGKTHIFESGIGNQITINGSFLTNSTDTTKAVLRSDSDGTQWYINATTATNFINKVDVKDSNASAGVQINAIGSTNAGNNTNWDFSTMPAYSWTGAVDNNWNTAGNWGTSVVPGVNDVALFSSVYSNNNCTINTNISVKGVLIEANYTGTITQGSGNTVTIGSTDWIQNGGTFVGSNAAITINGEFTVNGGSFTSTSATFTSNTTFSGTVFKIASGATFTHSSGLINFTGANHYNIYTAGNALNDVSINKGGTSNSNGDMVVAGDLEILASGTTNIAIELKGDLTGNNTNFAGGTLGQIKFTGTGSQSITYPGKLPSLIVDKASGTLSLDSDFTATRNLINLNGTVDPKTSTITLTTNHATITPNGMELYNLVWNNGGADVTVTNDLVIRNNLTLTSAGQINTGTLKLKGNLTTTDSSVTGSSKITFMGTSAQTATFNGNDIPNGLVTIDNSAGVTFIGTSSLNGSGQDLTVATGKLTVSTAGLTVTDLLTLEAGTTLEIPSYAPVTAARVSINDTSIVKYTPVTNAVNNTIDLNKFTQNYGYLEIDSSEIGDDYQFTKDTTVANELKLANSTTKVTQTTGTLTLKANLNNIGGSFTSNAKVVLSGASQQIAGSNTYYDLVKSEELTSTLTFAAGSTQAITNSIDLAGRPNNKLSLRSSLSGTQWAITLPGTASYSFLDIKDSNNTSTTVTLDQTNTDSGNNTGWSFSGTNSFTWVGNTSTNWATGSNWYGGNVPGVNDIAILDITTGTYAPTISGTASVGGVHINTDFNRVLTLATGAILSIGSQDLYVAGGEMDATLGTVIIDSSFTLTGSGTFSASAYRTYTKGDWRNQGGAFVDNSGQVIFNGTGDQVLETGGTSSTQDFYRISVEKTSGTLYLNSALKTLENLEIRGSSGFDMQGRNVAVGGDLYVFGTVTLLGGETLTYNGVLTNQGNVNYVGTGTYASLLLGNRYTNVTFKNGGTWTHTGDMYVDYGLYIEKNSTLISQAGTNILIRKVWSNEGGTYTANGSTVEFDGFMNEIYGTTTFYNLKKLAKVKNDWIIFFIGATDVITINGNMQMYGLPNSVMWFNGYYQYRINMQGTYDIKYCQVRACINLGSTITVDGTNINIGYNNNWVFDTAKKNTWTGAVSSNWATGGNWSEGVVPGTDDVATIANGINEPTIASTINVRGLVLDSTFTGTLTQSATGVLNIGRFGLHVGGGVLNGSAGDVTISGPLFQTGGTLNDGSGTISVSGFIDRSAGTLQLDSGNFKLNGATYEQNVNFGQVQSFKKLILNNTNNTLNILDYGVIATDLEVNAGAKVQFQEGSLTTVTNLTVAGTGSNYASLSSLNPGVAWGLNVTGSQSVNYLKVADADASTGNTITAVNSIDLSNNINWDFGGIANMVISFTPDKKPFKSDLDVSVSFTMPGTDGSGVQIYYTLDGSTPNNTKTLYTGTFVIDNSFSIKAVGYANGNYSSIFQKDYLKVDLAHLYVRKTYGAGASLRLGETRRFEAQVWWMGENEEPDNMEYYYSESQIPEFDGDDMRMPEFDDDIEWFSTGSTITKSKTTAYGGSAIWTDDGFVTGYTITVKIGPNSFTGCNNNTGKIYKVKCGDCEKDLGCLSSAPEFDPKCELIEGETCNDANPPPSNPVTCESSQSPIPIPTLGKKVEIHVAFNSGAYTLKPYSFGHGARATDFNELRVVDSNTLIVHFVSKMTSGYFQFIKNGSGKYFQLGGDEAYLEYDSINDEYKFNKADGGYYLFGKIDDLPSDEYRAIEFSDKSGNVITYDYETYKANDKMVITDASGNTYTVFAETIVEGVKLTSKVVTKEFATSQEKTWTYHYDANGNLTKERFEELYASAGYGDFLYEIDRHGNHVMFTDYNANQYLHEYDSTWRATKTTFPIAGERISERSYLNGTYDITTTDPLGNKTITTIDNGTVNSLVRKVIHPDGLVEQFDYNSNGFKTRIVQKLDGDSANDIVTHFFYDTFSHRTKTIVDPAGLAITTVQLFDSKGNVTRYIDPNGVITDSMYDSNNRLTKTIQDVGGLAITDESMYDATGNLTKQIDPITKIKIWEYDSFGRMTKAFDELSNYEVCEYDSAGNKTKHVDKNGNITGYQYDSLNRLTKTTDAAAYTEIKEYDGNNNVTRFTDRIGTVTMYLYDQLNRLTLIGGDAGAPGCSCSGGSSVNGQEGIYEYSWNGKLTKFTDIEYTKSNGVKGNFKLFEYDSMYRLTRTIVDPYGLMLIAEMEYDTLGRVTKNRKVNFDGPDIINITEYDKNSRVIITKQVLGNDYLVSSVEYDKMHNVTKSIDANGNFSQVFFDKVYRVTKTIDAENLTIVNNYNARSEITRVQVDPAGFNYITDTLYDDRGRKTKTIEPDGGVELCEYDPNGNKTKCTDPVGGIRQWLFDNRNMLTKAIDEASNFSTVEYDGLGNQTKVVNAEGTITHLLYNDKSFLTKTIEDVGGINRISEVMFDESGHQTKIIDPSGLVSEIYYDAAYRVTKTITDAGGKNIENTTMYDSLSRVTKTIDAGGFERVVEFDQVSRVTKQISPDGGTQSVIYDNIGNALTKTIKVTNSTNVSYSYAYNKTYQLTKSIEDTANLNITTVQDYDILHRLTKVTDANSNTTAYFYDSESRITRTLYADSNTIDSEYDQKGRITKRIDQKLDVMTYLYDSRDMLTKKTYGVSGEQTFTWDVMRRKTQDTDNNSNLQLITMGYEFDKLSRMTKQTQKIGSGTTQNVIRYFDSFGHRTRITYPHGRNVDTTFTALHQVNEIKTDVGAGIVTVANYDYLYDSGLDKRPLVSKNVLHSGTDTRVDFAYDSMGRVTKKNWVDISATTTLSGFEYTYDLYGNRLTDNQLDRSQDSHTYHYDSAQRFTKMERGTIGGTPSFYQSYTLDALANWSSFNNNGTTESRSHDVMNAITFRGATSLSHDLNGNLTNDGNQKYIWDELNRLVEVRDSGNNIICDYYYNADNLRVEKHHAGGAKEQFYYDGATVLVETDGSQTKVREYVNGGQYIDEVILVVNGSTYNYYMSDLRYCVTGFIDSSGAVVERARYDGYGKRTLLDASYATITTANVSQSYGYTGIRHDNESGLQYYRARYFDNYLGRFINRDPLGYVDGLSLYRGYFIIGGLDPSGLARYGPDHDAVAFCGCKDKNTCPEVVACILKNFAIAAKMLLEMPYYTQLAIDDPTGMTTYGGKSVTNVEALQGHFKKFEDGRRATLNCMMKLPEVCKCTPISPSTMTIWRRTFSDQGSIYNQYVTAYYNSNTGLIANLASTLTTDQWETVNNVAIGTAIVTGTIATGGVATMGLAAIPTFTAAGTAVVTASSALATTVSSTASTAATAVSTAIAGGGGVQLIQ